MDSSDGVISAQARGVLQRIPEKFDANSMAYTPGLMTSSEEFCSLLSVGHDHKQDKSMAEDGVDEHA